MKKVIIALLTLAMIGTMVAGCTPEEPAPSSSAPVETSGIGCMPADSNIQFFQLLAAGMEQAGKDLGITVDIQYTGRKVEKELSLTETFISQGYDGIVLETVDSSAITGAMQKAKDANVQFVAVDTVPEKPEMAASTVSSDNYSGGAAAAKLMKEMLPDGGDVIMIKFKHASIATDERYRGFEDELKDSNIKIVDSVAQDGTRDDTVVKLAPVLSKHPDVDGIFCAQGDPAIGALTAVTTAGMEDKVSILAFDIEGEVAAAITQGTAIKGGVAQFPYEMGYLAVVNCYKAIKGEKVENMLLLPVLPVSKDQMAEFTDDTTAYLEKYGNVKIK